MTTEETITLRQYMETRFAAQEKAMEAALAAAKEAVIKAEIAVEKRFENTNEWRNTVESLQRTYMPRTEFEQAKDAISDKLDILTKRIDAREAFKRGSGDAWALLVAVVALLATAGNFIFRAVGH